METRELRLAALRLFVSDKIAESIVDDKIVGVANWPEDDQDDCLWLRKNTDGTYFVASIEQGADKWWATA